MSTFSQKTFEEKRKEISKLNVIDDTFFHKMVEDKAVCQEIIRIILGKPDLMVREVTPQKSLRNAGNKSVVLDLLCTDDKGRLYNIEVQKSDNDNHVKRARYNQANIDTSFAERGIRYEDLPDIFIVFISRFDIFKRGKTVYHIDRRIRESDEVSDNGVYEVYVNAKGKDDSVVTELMQYFVDSTGYNEKFPLLSRRVDYFRNVKEGANEMCWFSEKLKSEGKMEVAQSMKNNGYSDEEIKRVIGYSLEELMQMADFDN